MLQIERQAVSLDFSPGLHKELGQFIRFGAVGMSSTFLDFGILSALKYLMGWPTLPANLVSYSCGMLNSYLLTTNWVYPQAKDQKKLIQLFQFVLINLIGLVLSNLIIVALEGPLGQLLNQPQLSYLPTKLVATVIVFFWNFFANRYWTFSRSGLTTGTNSNS
jgi:putative flippase GtrA